MLRRLGSRAALAILVTLAAACAESWTTITFVSNAVGALTITAEGDGPSGMPAPTAPLAMEVGDSVALSATATNPLGLAVSGVAATWSSSAPSVVAVDASGVAEALAPGEATIDASLDGTATATIRVVVTDATAVPPPA
jgi:hypothetical protein